MTTVITHGLAGIFIGAMASRPREPLRYWTCVAAASIVPDLDAIGFAFGIRYGDFLGHRGFSHSLCFALILAACMVLLLYCKVRPFSREWWRLLLVFFAVAVVHDVLDAMTDGGLGVAFFAPFENSRYFLPWRPIPVAPIGGLDVLFTRRGMGVLISEIGMVWMPGALLTAVVLWCRRRAAFTDA